MEEPLIFIAAQIPGNHLDTQENLQDCACELSPPPVRKTRAEDPDLDPGLPIIITAHQTTKAGNDCDCADQDCANDCDCTPIDCACTSSQPAPQKKKDSASGDNRYQHSPNLVFVPVDDTHEMALNQVGYSPPTLVNSTAKKMLEHFCVPNSIESLQDQMGLPEDKLYASIQYNTGLTSCNG